MPKGDGTGPPRGPMKRNGRMGGDRAGAGPGGYCICPSCGEGLPHQQGVPCYKASCLKCGKKMARG